MEYLLIYYLIKHPEQVRSLLWFHLYFTTRRILFQSGEIQGPVPLPGDSTEIPTSVASLKTERFLPGHTLTYRGISFAIAKTTGREDGPLKEDWGRADRQPRSKNDFGFGTKLRFINPFPHASLKPTCVSIT